MPRRSPRRQDSLELGQTVDDTDVVDPLHPLVTTLMNAVDA